MTNDYIASRYGKNPAKARNQRIFWTSVAAILFAAFLVWSVVINFSSPNRISASVQNFSVLSAQQTKATISVSNPGQRAGRCAIKVLNSGFFVVGYKEIEVFGASGKNSTVEAFINTTNIGVSASVDRCWFK